MIPYDLSFVPPAPALTVGVSAVDRPNQKLPVLALLDPAADITVLPDTLVDQLELAPVAETTVVGFEDRPVLASVYVVAVHTAGARLYPARVVTHRADYDGPDLQFEVKTTR